MFSAQSCALLFIIAIHFFLSLVCRYFLNGNNCRYGSHCRYLHPESIDVSQNDSVEMSTVNDGDSPSSSLPMSTPITVPLSSHLSVDAPEFVPSNFQPPPEPLNTAETETPLTNESGSDADTSQTISYAQIVSGNASNGASVFEHIEFIPNPLASATLCPYLNRVATADGLMCPYGTTCIYQHGDQCDICSEYCLHPTDETQRREHQSVSDLVPSC